MLYQSDFELGPLALNVNDLELEVDFYQQALGLQLHQRSALTADLGLADEILIHLRQTDDRTSPSGAYGLYHFAIVLPSREDLGTLFRHFLREKIPLIGASDHGYSEAIYLEDPEGNGIEIYRDRPQEDWDIRADGRIVGITEAMDAQAVYDAGHEVKSYRMPRGSRMGHIHLSVASSQKSSHFYQEVLGLADKFSIPSASWLASGHYHHHLAVNEWGGQDLLKRTEKMKGLAYYTLVYKDVLAYQKAIRTAQKLGLELTFQTNQAAFWDLDGIKTKLLLASSD